MGGRVAHIFKKNLFSSSTSFCQESSKSVNIYFGDHQYTDKKTDTKNRDEHTDTQTLVKKLITKFWGEV